MNRGSATPESRRTGTETRVNKEIRAREVRLVGPEGEQVGVVPVEQALTLATDVGLDLVEVAPNAKPPVCKLMDFGKYKYETALKARESRRNQQKTVLKQVNFRLKIDPNDYGTKRGHILRFLQAGFKVRVAVWLRGREQGRPEFGHRLLNTLAEEIAELGFVESAARQEGRNLIMIVAPHRTVREAADARRTRPEDGEPGL
nr:translation initiation factor IF-3 [Phytomonospora endophytica]